MVLLVAAIIGLCELALQSHRPLTYLVFPALMRAAIRFDERGATLAVVITTAFRCAISALRWFVRLSLDHELVLNTQLYIVVMALIEELQEPARGIPPKVLTELGLAEAVQTIAARSTFPSRGGVGGTLAIDSPPGVGTRLTAAMPTVCRLRLTGAAPPDRTTSGLGRCPVTVAVLDRSYRVSGLA